jgi:hypothetical protein
MEPLICPQCGGKITQYLPGQAFTTCSYCSTAFRIDQNKEKDVAPPVYEAAPSTGSRPELFVSVLIGVLVVFGALVFIGIVVSRRSTPAAPPYTPPRAVSPGSAASPVPSPVVTPNVNLLEFGGKGTGNGLFTGANSIAVDKQGRIYVSDDSLRVQQFNEKGEFISVLQVPEKTAHYRRARTINKIAVADDGKLYVAAGGAVLIYEPNSTDPFIIHAAPDYIQDFSLRSDGGLLLVSNNDEIETLIYVNKARKRVRAIDGFHTEAADAALSPRETGLSAIRLAVDGAGNIFSVYAFGDLGSYELNYNAEDLMIFGFTPEGRYVNKFVQSMSSCGIAVDNQSRVYVSGPSGLEVYTNTGQAAGGIADLANLNAFALDKDNNVYALIDDTVVKRPPVR